MIEVEKRFVSPTPEQQASLTRGAEFVKTKEITDTYYDSATFSLAHTDRWLRQRNDRFELKVPIDGGGKTAVVQTYRELETDAEIYQALALNEDADLATDLAKAGFKAFMTARTVRNSYKNHGFNIDIDKTTYENADFTYSGVDIEVMVEEQADIPAASARILEFASSHGLAIDGAPLGKIGNYIKNALPDDYKKLVAAGILPQA